MVKKCYNKILIDFFNGKMKTKTREDKRMITLESFFFETALFGHIYLKNLAHSLFGAWSSLLVHIRFTHSEGSKGFVNRFLKKSNHESWTMKSDLVKRPSSMVRLQNP